MRAREIRLLALAVGAMVLATGAGGCHGSADTTSSAPSTALSAALLSEVQGDLAVAAGFQGSGSTALHQQIFGGTTVDGPTYQSFFNSRVTGFGADDCGMNAAMACVHPERGPTLWLTPNFSKYDLPQMYRIQILYHESRHTEADHGYWMHANCPNPFLDSSGNPVMSLYTNVSLAGSAACDTEELGAYALGVIMLKNIQKFCTNCTGKVLTDAGFFSDATLIRIIDPTANAAIVNDLK